MIAVIADDFTGAAEIGGLGLLYGIKTAIVTQVEGIHDIDLLVIATEMRSLDPEKAAEESARITRELLELKPEFIYKKIDSILRGNIVAEIEAQLKVSNKTRALVIPANPILNRTIKDGVYYIDERPLINSKFADDLVYMAKSSSVLELIGEKEDFDIVSVSHTEKLQDRALLIGDTVNVSDLNKWVQSINGELLPVGGAGFFDAILRKKYENKGNFDVSPISRDKKELYICGSNFPLSKKAVISARENGFTVSGMPDSIYYNHTYDEKLIEKWAEEIIYKYKSQNQIIVSVLQQSELDRISGKQMKYILGSLVKKIFEKQKIDELFIEGGSTAYVIVKELSINTFYPVQSLAPGVTRMRITNENNLHLTMKPGSYKWPKSIWKFDKNNNYE